MDLANDKRLGIAVDMDSTIYNYKLKKNSLNNKTYSLLHTFLDAPRSLTSLHDTQPSMLNFDLHTLDYEIIIKAMHMGM